MSIIYEAPMWDPFDRHECELPYPYRTDKARNAPAFGEGSVWECADCGKHWRYTYAGLSYFRWTPVHWWNFVTRSDIRKAQQ